MTNYRITYDNEISIFQKKKSQIEQNMPASYLGNTKCFVSDVLCVKPQTRTLPYQVKCMANRL